jgi:hypothetical protein
MGKVEKNIGLNHFEFISNYADNLHSKRTEQREEMVLKQIQDALKYDPLKTAAATKFI